MKVIVKVCEFNWREINKAVSFDVPTGKVQSVFFKYFENRKTVAPVARCNSICVCVWNVEVIDLALINSF